MKRSVALSEVHCTDPNNQKPVLVAQESHILHFVGKAA